MPAHSKRIDVSPIRGILARKKKADVFLFIPDRKAIVEGSFVTSPPTPETELLINISAIRIKRLVLQTFNHGLHERRVLLRRSLADYSNDTRHIVITGQRSEDRDQKVSR